MRSHHWGCLLSPQRGGMWSRAHPDGTQVLVAILPSLLALSLLWGHIPKSHSPQASVSSLLPPPAGAVP